MLYPLYLPTCREFLILSWQLLYPETTVQCYTYIFLLILLLPRRERVIYQPNSKSNYDKVYYIQSGTKKLKLLHTRIYDKFVAQQITFISLLESDSL